MGEGEACVQAGGVGMASELVEWHQVIFADVEVDASGHNLLNEFAKAFDELNGAVRFREGHILLVVLGDDGDECLLPGRMMDP